MMRSLLFVPGDSRRKFDKAVGTSADALVLDMEDSVAASEKMAARAIVAEMLQADRAGKIMIVRVNAYETGTTLDDLAAVMPFAPDAVMLPKCRGGADVELLGHHLSAMEAANGLAAGATGIVAVATESGESVLGLSTYRPHPRLRGLLWGAEDLIASINATGNRDGEVYSGPFLLARNLCLMAASAAGVAAIDTVCTNLGDLEYVAAEARAARRDGFSAKAVIHPNHVEPVNNAFRPSEEEIGWANAVLQAFADKPEQGVVQIDGKMIDKPHERAAQRIVSAKQ